MRSLAGGEVVAILDDYLNQTVAVRHPDVQSDSGAVFHTLFSHIHPVVRAPAAVHQGQLLGNVGSSAKSGAPAHLHLTGAWIPETITPDKLTMDLIHPAFAPIVLVNFNSLIGNN